jgi:hypothetical protein
MISVERTYDVALLDSIIRNPSIYAGMCDDKCPKSAALVSVGAMVDAFVFILVRNDNDPCGCFIYEPHGRTFAVHTALLPTCRGRNAINAAILSLDWVFNRTECEKVTSYAFSDSPQVAWFARVVGLEDVGQEDYPNTRDGKPVTITKFEITKDKFRK